MIFFKNQKSLCPDSKKLNSWIIETEDLVKNINEEIDSLSAKIESLFEKEDELCRCEQTLKDIKIEKKYYNEYPKKINSILKVATFRKTLKAQDILDLWLYMERLQVKQDKISFFNKIKLWFYYNAQIDDFYDQSFSAVIDELKRLYYKKSVIELENKIKELSSCIGEVNLDKIKERHLELCKKVFRHNIAKRYTKSEYKLYDEKDLWKKSEQFIKSYPVVLSTTYSLRGCLSHEYLYDYVIMDEASQIDLATFLLSLSCAKNIVVVGDAKQLANVIDLKTKKELSKISKKYKSVLSPEYIFENNSTLSSVTKLFKDIVPIQLLEEHYRCHPKIIEFCNKTFYNNQLKIYTKTKSPSISPLKVFYTVKGNHAAENKVNYRQIETIFKEVVDDRNMNLKDGSVGIITPYKNQASAIAEELKQNNATETLSSTVHKFQGRECDRIIFSTVDNKISDFASNPNSLNVAISRAKDQLVVVTNGNKNSRNTGIDKLIDYIEYSNFEITTSEIRSVFDYLYIAYYARKNIKRKSKYDSENLMLDLIYRVMKENDFRDLKVLREYLFRDLVDIQGPLFLELTEEEKKYVKNPFTRFDFLIYRTTAKKPILIIEVDGESFHNNYTEKGKKQLERDIMKNNILTKYKIPYIRFSTKGSDEYTKLTKKLKEVVGRNS
ncbi:MAG: DUF2726 domain-containing protein [Bifidobacteriaceae bacterium]|jgi:hypothetical protein|nr:DUF2726 domain-containing protein [Bifidobacteriaceae bacterium]